MYNPLIRRKWKRVRYAFTDNISDDHVWYWYDPIRDTVYMATSRYAVFKCEPTYSMKMKILTEVDRE